MCRKAGLTRKFLLTTCYSITHVLCVHDIATLADRSDGLVGVDPQRVNSRGNSPRFAIASTRVRRDVELHAVRDADFTSVTCEVATQILRVQCHLLTPHHTTPHAICSTVPKCWFDKLQFHLSCTSMCQFIPRLVQNNSGTVIYISHSVGWWGVG